MDFDKKMGFSSLVFSLFYKERMFPMSMECHILNFFLKDLKLRYYSDIRYDIYLGIVSIYLKLLCLPQDQLEEYQDLYG